MATYNPDKTPPPLTGSASYEDWKKLVNIWSTFTTLQKEKQGTAILLTLKGSDQEAVLELEQSEINATDGLTKVLARLDSLYLKDLTLQKYKALEDFESYRRPTSMPINDFIHEFEKRHHKIKSHGTTISEDLLAFRLLKAANLPTADEKLAKGTSELTYTSMKQQLKKLFSESNSFSSDSSNIPRFDEINIHEAFYEEPYDKLPYDTLYTRGSRRPWRSNNAYRYPSKGAMSSNWRSAVPSSQTKMNHSQQRNSFYQSSQIKANQTPQRNPSDQYGNITKCNICESVMHWAPNCPHLKSSALTFFTPSYNMLPSTEITPLPLPDKPNEEEYEIVLHQSDHDTPQQMNSLISESTGYAVMDCGASKTVMGATWWQMLYESFPPALQQQCHFSSSSRFFKFGDGEKYKSLVRVNFPGKLGNKNVRIDADVVSADIPLLFSKESMKKAGMCINFKTDKVSFQDQELPLTVTQSGHYIIPITTAAQNLQDSGKQSVHITLSTQTTALSKKEIASKLHRQFAHASTDRIIKLLKRAGEPWNNDTELYNELHTITDSCDTCAKYRKPLPRPAVGLPLATQFLECVSFDLKFIGKHIIIHFIDQATRLSAAARITNKKPETIVGAIIKHWISIFGTAGTFHTDNGGEFVNEELIQLSQQFGITLNTTAAYSPWSNGTIERHNLILAEMVEKVIADTNCHIDVGLAWSVNAKNSLNNVHGFSSYQLAMGQNPPLPSVLTAQPPAYTTDAVTSQVLMENLKALHAARQAFTEAESSARIRRALSSNVRSYADATYLPGDKVYYHRQGALEWRGPATVLGKDGQIVLLKHGGYYIRVHPCRLTHVPSAKTTSTPSIAQGNLTVTPQCVPTYEDDDDTPSVDHNPQHDAVVQQSNSHASSTASDHKSQTETSDLNISHPEQSSSTSISTQLPCQTPQSFTPSIGTSSEQCTSSTSTQALSPSLPNKSVRKLCPGDLIKVTFNDASSSIVKIHSRSGKVTGAWAQSWNVINTAGVMRSIDLKKDISSWEFVVSDLSVKDHEFVSTELYQAQVCDDITTAIEKELAEWKTREVYTPVDDNGQDRITTRWVITTKEKDGKTMTKARLCARGFQEQNDFRTDSPTCSRETTRLTLIAVAAHQWDLYCIDIKRAFLQGKEIERTVFLQPPQEAKTQKLWQLRKCVYGLSDAPREFYCRLREQLESSQAITSSLDQCLFIWKKDDQHGIAICHVDDILFGGDPQFHDVVISPLESTFSIGTRNANCFSYIGMCIKQLGDKSIEVNQHSYAATIQPLNFDKSKPDHSPLTSSERSNFRSIVGQLNWLAGITRPDLSFDVCQLSSVAKESTITDAKLLNKAVRKAHNESVVITYPQLNLAHLKIQCFSDASYANLPQEGSQGGNTILLTDGKRSAPLQWASNRLKRVVRSTLAAETLSLNSCCDNAIYLKTLVESALHLPPGSTPIECIIDNKSLYDNIHSTKPVSEQRLRVDIAAIREMVARKELTITWKDNRYQLADCLTKRGASPQLLIKCLQSGAL